MVVYDNALTRATLGGGAWALPLSAMVEEVLQDPAQSVDAATTSTQWWATWPTPEVVRVVALWGISCSRTARWRIRLYRDEAGADLLYDSGWISIFPPRAAWGTIPFGAVNWWDGLPTAEELSLYPRSATHTLDQSRLAQRLDVEIDDATPLGGVVEIPYATAGDAVIATTNYDWRSRSGRRARTQMAETPGGQQIHERRAAPRTHQLTLGWQIDPEARQVWPDMEALMDLDRPMLVIPRPDDEAYRSRETILARFVQLGTTEPWALGWSRRSVAWEEML